MKNRITKYILLPVLAVVLILGLAYIFRTDPIMMISGKRLSGEELVYPENWLFTNEYQTIKVETNPENPHSVTTLCFVREGKLIIPAQEGHTKQWPQYALEDNRARIKVGEHIYPVRLSLVEKDAKIAELEQGGGGQSLEQVLEQVRDARAGSVVLTVEPDGNNITLGLTIEQSDNLTEWTKLDGEMTRTIPIPDGKKFYRFALDK